MINDRLRDDALEIVRLDEELDSVFAAGNGSQDSREYREALDAFWSKWSEVMEAAWEAPAGIALRIPGAVEAGISYLETAPRFFRSGYLAEEIMRELKRIPLEERQRRRLQIVVIREIVAPQARGRYTASLAGALLDDDFDDALRQFGNTPGVVGRRAQRVLREARHWKRSNAARVDAIHSGEGQAPQGLSRPERVEYIRDRTHVELGP